MLTYLVAVTASAEVNIDVGASETSSITAAGTPPRPFFTVAKTN